MISSNFGGRRSLIEAADAGATDLPILSLSRISAVALWDAEINPQSLEDNSWQHIGRGGLDTAAVLAAHIRAVRWNSATAADRDLLQAPFRARIRLDSYQLLPLRKALRLPRVNMLIADDVGLGNTIEAGLIVRELLLRRRIDLVVVAAPAAMTAQWKDELESKFGLSFIVIDCERVSRKFGARADSPTIRGAPDPASLFPTACLPTRGMRPGCATC